MDLSDSEEEGDGVAAGVGDTVVDEGPSGAGPAAEERQGGPRASAGEGPSSEGGAAVNIASGETGDTSGGAPLRHKGKGAVQEGEVSKERRPMKRGYRFHDKSRGLSVQYNADHCWVPDFLISDLPDAMVQSQLSPKVFKEMQAMKEEHLIQMQSHLAFSSALVGKYLGFVARAWHAKLSQAVKAQAGWREDEAKYRAKIVALKKEAKESIDAGLQRETAKENRIKTLAASLETVAREAEKERLAATSAVSSMWIQSEARAKERVAWEAERLALLAENERLKDRIASDAAAAAQAATLASDSAIASLKAEVESLSKKVTDDATAASLLTGQVQAEAVAAYKVSEDYLGDMSDFQIAALSIMKKAMIKDGRLSREVASRYDYETCLERDIQGEFVNIHE